jgi:hypothetical protein
MPVSSPPPLSPLPSLSIPPKKQPTRKSTLSTEEDWSQIPDFIVACQDSGDVSKLVNKKGAIRGGRTQVFLSSFSLCSVDSGLRILFVITQVDPLFRWNRRKGDLLCLANPVSSLITKSTSLLQVLQRRQFPFSHPPRSSH